MKVEEMYPTMHQTIVQLKSKGRLSLEERYLLQNMEKEMEISQIKWEKLTAEYGISDKKLRRFIQFRLNKQEMRAIRNNIMDINKNEWTETDRRPNRLLADVTRVFGCIFDPILKNELIQFEEDRKQLQVAKEKFNSTNYKKVFNIKQLKKDRDSKIANKYDTDFPEEKGQNVTMAYKKQSLLINCITNKKLSLTARVNIWENFFDEYAKELSAVDPKKSAEMAKNADTLNRMALQANLYESDTESIGKMRAHSAPQLNANLEGILSIPPEIKHLAAHNRMDLECIYNELQELGSWLKNEKKEMQNHIKQAVYSKDDNYIDPDASKEEIKDHILLKAIHRQKEIFPASNLNPEVCGFLNQVIALQDTPVSEGGASEDTLAFFKYGLVAYALVDEKNYDNAAKVFAAMDTRQKLIKNLDHCDTQLQDFKNSFPLFSKNRIETNYCGGRYEIKDIIKDIGQLVGGREKTNGMAIFMDNMGKIAEAAWEKWTTASKKLFEVLEEKEARKTGHNRVMLLELPAEEQQRVINLRHRKRKFTQIQEQMEKLDDYDMCEKGLFGNDDLRERTKEIIIRFGAYFREYIQEMDRDAHAMKNRTKELMPIEATRGVPDLGETSNNLQTRQLTNQTEINGDIELNVDQAAADMPDLSETSNNQQTRQLTNLTELNEDLELNVDQAAADRSDLSESQDEHSTGVVTNVAELENENQQRRPARRHRGLLSRVRDWFDSSGNSNLRMDI